MSHATPVTARERFVRWQPRFELCAMCRSPTRGFGWQEPQRMSKPRPPAWFCSMACQTFFWERARRSFAMVDLTDEEKSALRYAMKMAAEVMEEIGWNTRLSDLSEQQVLTLMEVAVGGFQDAMRDIAAANKQSLEVPF
jgi:hypothetical protein